MKCIAAIVLLALLGVALSKPLSESAEPLKLEAVEAAEAVAETPRDKRGLLLGAAYTAPIAYSAYTAPFAYSSPYSYPYAYSGYSGYSGYPYYASAYTAPYVLA